MHVAHATLPPSWLSSSALALHPPLVLQAGECVQLAASVNASSVARTIPVARSGVSGHHRGEALSNHGGVGTQATNEAAPQSEEYPAMDDAAGDVAAGASTVCELLGCKAVERPACITCEPQSALGLLPCCAPACGDGTLQCE